MGLHCYVSHNILSVFQPFHGRLRYHILDLESASASHAHSGDPPSEVISRHAVSFSHFSSLYLLVGTIIEFIGLVFFVDIPRALSALSNPVPLGSNVLRGRVPVASFVNITSSFDKA